MRTLTALLGATLLLLTGQTSFAATNGQIVVPPANSACGVVRLPAGSHLNLAAAVSTASRGYRAIYLVRLGRSEPIDLLAAHVNPIGTKTVQADTVLLGATSTALPAGLYRLCVFTDRPTTLAIAVSTLHSRLTLDMRSVRSSAYRPATTSAGPPVMYTNEAMQRIPTTANSLVYVSGVARYDKAAAGTYDTGVCLVAAGSHCADGNALYGTGTQLIRAGDGAEVDADYWTANEAGPGTFSAGFEYRGTLPPADFAAFVLTANL